MNASEILALIGLTFTLFGAGLLFFWGLPKKKINNNVLLIGDQAFQLGDTPPSQWQPAANAFLRKAKHLNQTGFALVAIGTLLQMLAIII